MRRTHLPLALTALAFFARCDNGTTQAAIPIYEASTPEGGFAFPIDAGTDARDASLAVDAGKDATIDVVVPADVQAPSEAAPTDADHDAGDAGSDSAVDAGNDAGKDSGHDAGVDAPIDAAKTTDTGAGDATGAPDVDNPPLCETVNGTLGWYNGNTSALICAIACTGLPITCKDKGTASQGWYTTSGFGCGHVQEVLNDHNCQ
jgi:hypothetical protein